MLKRPRKRSPIGCPEPGEDIDIKTIQIDLFGRRPYYLVLVALGEGFNTDDFTPPLESMSKEQGSQAIYYAAHKEEGLLLQGLPTNCVTSSHDHEHVGWAERNSLLAGKAELCTYERQHQLIHQYQLTEASPVGPVINSDVLHRTRTPTNQPSLIVIEIKGDHGWFEKWKARKGHRFRQFPKP